MVIVVWVFLRVWLWRPNKRSILQFTLTTAWGQQLSWPTHADKRLQPPSLLRYYIMFSYYASYAWPWHNKIVFVVYLCGVALYFQLFLLFCPPHSINACVCRCSIHSLFPVVSSQVIVQRAWYTWQQQSVRLTTVRVHGCVWTWPPQRCSVPPPVTTAATAPWASTCSMAVVCPWHSARVTTRANCTQPVPPCLLMPAITGTVGPCPKCILS